jgi:hypothetical protein
MIQMSNNAHVAGSADTGCIGQAIGHVILSLTFFNKPLFRKPSYTFTDLQEHATTDLSFG